MELIDIDLALGEAGIRSPNFPFLKPDEYPYKIAFYQPGGKIGISRSAIKNHDHETAHRQHLEFLRWAATCGSDLAVTPEYSCPWSVIFMAAEENVSPAAGKIWTLGCESITKEELRSLTGKLGDKYKVIYDPRIEQAPGRFADPACIIFKAQDNEGKEKIVVLIQFKTKAMADREHFEVNNLQEGKAVYVFKNAGGSNRLITLICSDSLGLQDRTWIQQKMAENTLLVHLQLNPNPRSANFRGYRDHCFLIPGDNTEILCFNWASCASSEPPGLLGWKKIAASALYTKSADINISDVQINANHHLGLYITYAPSQKAFCFFFNYASGVYFFETTKPSQRHAVVAQHAKRVGPEMLNHLSWNAERSTWVKSSVLPDDGFKMACADIMGGNFDVLFETYDPINIERLVVISSGDVGSEHWHEVDELKYVKIDASEEVGRLTFAQDPSCATQEERKKALSLFSGLVEILAHNEKIPIWLTELKSSSKLIYTQTILHRNLRSPQSEYATVVYLGNNPSRAKLNEVYDQLRELVVKAEARTIARGMHNLKVVVWYRENNKLMYVKEDERPEIDEDVDNSPADIMRDAK